MKIIRLRCGGTALAAAVACLAATFGAAADEETEALGRTAMLEFNF
jgi:hypothetical protein